MGIQIQTEDPMYVRDIHSKALLSTDRVALDNHRHRQIMVSQQSFEWQQMKTKVDELNTVKDEMLEIKALLQKILLKKEL